jgi:hypothetical protein
MKEITRAMLHIYKPYSDLDWMNYKIVKKDLTFHHIVKRVNGGKKEISNGALLMDYAHNYLHIIEDRQKHYYDLLNQIFMIINKQQHEPDINQREAVEFILRDFEYHNLDELNSKGKILIKDKYLRRWY